MINTLKTFVTIFALMGLLAGCSSNQPVEEPATDPVDTPETVEPADVPDEDPVEPVDPLEGVDTVFYFEFDQSILNSAARSALMAYAEVFKDSPRSIRLEGHADERGSREYNMALGERRANAVRDFLVLQGVSSGMIETVSYGEERPEEVGSYESAWSQNRRVEIKY